MVLGIFGAGGFGREVVECVRQIEVGGKKWDRVVFIDDKIGEAEVNGIPVFRYKVFKQEYSIENAKIFIAQGEPNNREKLWKLVKKDGYKLETIINPTVWIPDTTKIGEGVYIGYESFISCNIIIEDNSVIMPCASIGHDSAIGKHCVCGGQSNIAGNCRIGDYCFLGLNCIIREKLSIPEWTIISAGSAVLKDINESDCIIAGVPARIIQRNEKHCIFK